MLVSRNEIRAAGSKRISHANFTLTWPVFRNYREDKVEGDVLLHAVMEPKFPRRTRDPSGGLIFSLSPADFQDQQDRSVRRYIAPLIEYPDLFLQFARLAPRRPVEEEEALEIAKAWVHEYGVLGLAAADTESNPGRHERLRAFWDTALKASETLELYQAAIVEVLDERLTTALQRWGHNIEAESLSLHGQREYALKHVGNRVGTIVREECYSMLVREAGRPESGHPAFSYGLGFHSLLGAMYLQMMLLMTDASTVRQCKRPGCQGIIPARSRQDRLYCSPACKQWVWDNK